MRRVEPGSLLLIASQMVPVVWVGVRRVSDAAVGCSFEANVICMVVFFLGFDQRCFPPATVVGCSLQAKCNKYGQLKGCVLGMGRRCSRF